MVPNNYYYDYLMYENKKGSPQLSLCAQVSKQLGLRTCSLLLSSSCWDQMNLSFVQASFFHQKVIAARSPLRLSQNTSMTKKGKGTWNNWTVGKRKERTRKGNGRRFNLLQNSKGKRKDNAMKNK